ncbi:hypothetical protein GCM10009819_16920 [Agromyces tropicus]|uniref:Signal transduction histidine kinase subgroup 3 dimerisation and phosphoacceptor domain-containing protein n=1 Tax=Agromyces tropicus TaxID=555371 RepID=A0ABP5FX25_9MICO
MAARSRVREPAEGPTEIPRGVASHLPAPTASGVIAAMAASAVAVLVAAGVVLHAARSDRMLAPEPVVAWAESAALVLLVAGAWLSVRRAPLAVGCGVAAVGIGVPVLAGAQVAPGDATTVGIGLAPLMVGAAAVVAVEYAEVGTRSARTVLWVLAAAAGALIVLTVDPIDEAACLRRCPDTVAPMSGSIGSAVAVASASGVSVACLVIALAIMIREHGVRRTAARAALAAGALMALAQSLRAASWEHIDAWPWGAAAIAAGAALLGTTVVMERLVRVRATADVRRLADRLRDPGAGRAVFPALDDAGWVDPEGEPVAEVSGFRTELTDERGVIARLALGRRARTLPASELDPADLLAIRNARMTASAIARVRWLEESRRLVLASAALERERVEHDLHDGAQQRLVSALLFLAVARRELGDSADLTEAESQIRIALEHLRELSHGTRRHDEAEGRST